MFRIPMADGVLLVDGRFKSYDPDDGLDIYSIEWEVGITIPKSVWWDLRLSRDQLSPGIMMWDTGKPEWFTYIHEYIWAFLCANETPESNQPLDDW